LHQQLAAATVSGDDVVLTRRAAVLAEVALTAGDIDLAISYHLQAIAAAERIGQPYWSLEVGQALLDACRGDLDDAEQRLAPLLAQNVPIAVEFAQLPAAWIDLERGDLDVVGARVIRMGPVRSLGVATFTLALLLIEARWRERKGDPRSALNALDEADRVNGDLFEPGRPDRLILRARVASQLGDVAVISDVRDQLLELIELGGGNIISAGAEWAQGLHAHHQRQPREALRRLQAAGDKCEQSSRFVLAVEAWSDLATAATADGDRDTQLLATRRARRIGQNRRLIALLSRLDGIVGEASDEPAGPPAFDALTRRQREIALLVAAGRTNRQIGAQLYLSEHTIRNQLVDIYARLCITRRAELTALTGRGTPPTHQ
jgi:DNA-binding NarL/FixJ family response regulator